MRVSQRYGSLSIFTSLLPVPSSQVLNTPATVAAAIVTLLTPNSSNPTADQIESAIYQAIPAWPNVTLSTANVQAAAASVIANVPPSQAAYAQAIAASIAATVAAITGSNTDVANAANAALGVAATVASDAGTAWYQEPGADLVVVGADANGNPINAEGQSWGTADALQQLAALQAKAQAKVAAAMAASTDVTPSCAGIVAGYDQNGNPIDCNGNPVSGAAPSGTDYSWLYWAGGGVAILGLGLLLAPKAERAMRFRDAPAAVTDLVVVSYNSLGFGVNAEGQIVPGAFGTPTAGAATRSARVVLNTPALTVMLAPKTLNPTAVTQAIAANTARDVAAITQSVQNSPPVPGPASAAAPPAPADLGSQAVAASAPVPLIAAPSGTDYSWLYWAGGGVAILGLGYAILKKRKKATP